MHVEVQIRSSVFESILTRSLQSRLRTICFPSIQPAYVDHVDVAPAPPELTADGGIVHIRMFADVFIVRREQVLAAPNAVPAGAATPAARGELLLDLSVSGAAMTLQCVDIKLGAADAMLDAAAKEDIKKKIGSNSFDFTAALNSLGVPSPIVSRVELVDGVVAIRLDPVGDAASHLHPAQEWGLFIDSASVELLAKTAIPADRLGTVVPGLTMNAHWNPQGDVPHVHLATPPITITMGLVKGDITFNAGCTFSLLPPAGFHIAVDWDVHADFGALVPRFVEKYIESQVAGALDPTKFGGVPTGDRSFVMDRLLPLIGFSGARFRYDSALASAEGMTIGGPVTLPVDVDTSTLTILVRAFEKSARLVVCSEGPRRGSGGVEPQFVRTVAKASLQDLGALCDCEFLAPNEGVEQYASGTGAGVDEVRDIWVSINGLTALGFGQPIRLIVRTARGVRLIDLGVPDHVKTDEDGFVIDAKIIFIDDCMYLPKSPFDHGINWGSVSKINFLIDPDPIDWWTFAGGRGLSVQLISLTGLEPGELVQFRSSSHAIDVTADRAGAAVVPVLLRLFGAPETAYLIRVNRRPLEGRVAMRSAVFERHATVRGGRTHRLASFAKGTALLHSEFGDRSEVHLLGHLGVLTRVERHPRHAMDQVLSPKADCDLPGLVSMIPIPGFAQERVAIAVMTDQSKLVVEQTDDGFRVAGTFRGPIEAVNEAEDWAVFPAGDQLCVYSVTRGAAPGRPIPGSAELQTAGPSSNSRPCGC
jgi:hypothetical protein